jgi:hypothetical protein
VQGGRCHATATGRRTCMKRRVVAGLGTVDRRSAQPLALREQLRFTYFLLWDWSAQKSPVESVVPQDDLRKKNKKFHPQNAFSGPGLAVVTPTSLCKNLVKNRKTNFRRQAIQEPIFSVANVGFEGGCDGRGCVCGTFLVICTQPSHRRTCKAGNGEGLVSTVPGADGRQNPSCCASKAHTGPWGWAMRGPWLFGTFFQTRR